MHYARNTTRVLRTSDVKIPARGDDVSPFMVCDFYLLLCNSGNLHSKPSKGIVTFENTLSVEISSVENFVGKKYSSAETFVVLLKISLLFADENFYQ